LILPYFSHIGYVVSYLFFKVPRTPTFMMVAIKIAILYGCVDLPGFMHY